MSCEPLSPCSAQTLTNSHKLRCVWVTYSLGVLTDPVTSAVHHPYHPKVSLVIGDKPQAGLWCCRQRKAEEDTQQSSHQEQVNALWQRLEDAAAANKQEVQHAQQQLEDASSAHKHTEQELRQAAADAASAHKQEVQSMQQRLQEASVAYRQEVEGLQQQQEQAFVEQGCRHDSALTQVSFQV